MGTQESLREKFKIKVDSISFRENAKERKVNTFLSEGFGGSSSSFLPMS